MYRSLLTVLLLCVTTVASRAQAIYSDNVLAVVNEEVITLYDVASFTYPVELQLRKKYLPTVRPTTEEEVTAFKAAYQIYQDELKKLRREGAQRLIDVEVLYAEFVRQGYNVPPDALDRRIDQIVASSSTAKGSYEVFEQELAERNLTLNSLREQLYKTIAVEMLENALINSRIAVTPSKVERYYRENPALFSKPGAVTLKMLIIDQKAGESPAAYRERLAAIRSDVAANRGQFDAMVKKYMPAAMHGSSTLPNMQESEINPDMRATLSSLTTGALGNSWVSVDAGEGKRSFLIYVHEATDAQLQELTDEMRIAIRNRIYTEEKRRMTDDLVKRLRSQAYIRTFFDETTAGDEG